MDECLVLSNVGILGLGGRRSTSDGAISTVGVGMGGRWSTCMSEVDTSALGLGRGGGMEASGAPLVSGEIEFGRLSNVDILGLGGRRSASDGAIGVGMGGRWPISEVDTSVLGFGRGGGMEASGSWLVSERADDTDGLSNVGILGLGGRGGRWFVSDGAISTVGVGMGGRWSTCMSEVDTSALGLGRGGGMEASGAPLVSGEIEFGRLALSNMGIFGLGGRRSTSDGGTSDIGVGMGGRWSMDNSALRFGRGGASGGWP